MSMRVLQNKAQIKQARSELDRRGLSSLDPPALQLLRKLHLSSAGGSGDVLKSWDVLRSIELIEQRVPKSGALLDIGAFGSEIPVALYRLGYRNVAGVDLNPKLRESPHADVIRYELADFMQTPFAAESFDAITAISVIEHGFQSERLLREMQRLLRPGGLFVASFDYWPQKIDTGGQKFFGLDWLIFSEQETRAFIEEARAHGLVPIGAMDFAATDRPISCVGQQYTFGWLALEKSK
jgi:SAM-dependent methyltransferase